MLNGSKTLIRYSVLDIPLWFILMFAMTQLAGADTSSAIFIGPQGVRTALEKERDDKQLELLKRLRIRLKAAIRDPERMPEFELELLRSNVREFPGKPIWDGNERPAKDQIIIAGPIMIIGLWPNKGFTLPCASEPPSAEQPCGYCNGSLVKATGAETPDIPAFTVFAKDTFGINLISFNGKPLVAVRCLIDSSKMFDGTSEFAGQDGKPLLLGWNEVIYLRIEHSATSDPIRTLWMPVFPEEPLLPGRAIQRLSQAGFQILNALNFSDLELAQLRFSITVGRLNDWITITLRENDDGTVSKQISVGMAEKEDFKDQNSTAIKF